VRLLAYDEHRLGLRPVYRRVWARRGERPLAVGAHRYRWFYVCTFVEPETGESLSLLVDGVDTEVMGWVLRELRAWLGEGEEAWVVLDRGYLLLDDVLIQRYRSGKLGLKKARDTSTGAWVFGLSLVVLAWTDGKRRIPLAFLPYFGEEESKLDLALALLEWAKEAGFRPEGVLFDAWYAARQVLEWLHAHGWPFVTRLRSNRVLDGVQLRRRGGTRWVKAGRLRGLTFAVGVLKRGGKFYGTDRESWWGVGMREIYRLRQAIEEIFRGLQRELGWTGHRHWRRARLLAHLALGLVAYGLIERQREGLGLSFYQCRRRLIAGKLSLDLSPLLPVQAEAA
jgi:putative transposase